MKKNFSISWRLVTHLAGAGFLVVCSLVFYIGGVRSLMHGQKDAQAHLDALQRRRTIAAELEQSLKEREGKLLDARKTLKNDSFQLRPSGEVNKRIAEIARLVGECGLKLDEIQPAKATVGPRFDTVPIRLVGSGNYSTCVALLHRLWVEFPDTAVVSLEMEGNPNDSRVSTKFRIDLLWHAAPAQYAMGG